MLEEEFIRRKIGEMERASARPSEKSPNSFLKAH